MALKRVRYIGPHPEVELQDGTGDWVTVKRHGHLDLPTSLANNLAKQEENWEIVKPDEPKPEKAEDEVKDGK